MSRHRSSSVEGKVYVGDLPPDASEKELERAFNYYGHLRNVWVARNPPGFAFVEFEDYRDAEDAVRALDGTYVQNLMAKIKCMLTPELLLFMPAYILWVWQFEQQTDPPVHT